jgi:SAM-dependent methyltransferase
MNDNHSTLCSSPEWADFITNDVLTPLAESIDLGEELLELGPGYGAATRWLCHKVRRMTALELDPEMAERLREELANTNVVVEVGDCTHTRFADESFDSVATFTMLHHLPTTADQYTALTEAYRLLRWGGVLVGSDSLASTELHAFHEGDTYNPIDPARLLVFLQAIGFPRVTLAINGSVTFTAHKVVDGCGQD